MRDSQHHTNGNCPACILVHYPADTVHFSALHPFVHQNRRATGQPMVFPSHPFILSAQVFCRYSLVLFTTSAENRPVQRSTRAVHASSGARVCCGDDEDIFDQQTPSEMQCTLCPALGGFLSRAMGCQEGETILGMVCSCSIPVSRLAD